MPKSDSRKPELIRFGERMRELREASGKSQDVFALDSGIHRTYIGKCERGQVNPSLMNLLRIARGLGVVPGDLINELD